MESPLLSWHGPWPPYTGLPGIGMCSRPTLSVGRTMSTVSATFYGIPHNTIGIPQACRILKEAYLASSLAPWHGGMALFGAAPPIGAVFQLVADSCGVCTWPPLEFTCRPSFPMWNCRASILSSL